MAGLSTWLWQGKADEVVGVEPSTDMLAQAEKRRALYPDGASNVRFVNALSTATGLPDSSVGTARHTHVNRVRPWTSHLKTHTLWQTL